MVNETHKLAYDLSRSTLRDQAERLSDLRTRAGTVLAAASIAGSFLGVTHGTIDTLAVLALIAYLANVAASIYVLLPHELTTEFRGTVVLDLAEEVGATEDEVYEITTRWLEKIRGDNAPTLRSLRRWYVTAVGALAAEVVLWILALTT
jgi:hypothetical protein